VAVRLVSPAGDYIPPDAMQLDAPPPQILWIAGPDSVALDNTRSVAGGDLVSLNVRRLSESGAAAVIPPSSVHINVGGVDHLASTVTYFNDQGSWVVQFVISRGVPYGPQPLRVEIGTRGSAAAVIAVRN
jgi:hypothetical protein